MKVPVAAAQSGNSRTPASVQRTTQSEWNFKCDAHGQVHFVLSRHGDSGSALGGAANDRQEHDADENLRHAERFARAFRNAHQNFAHPSRQHRRAAEDGERHAPEVAVAVRFVPVSLDACERGGMHPDGKQQIKSVRMNAFSFRPGSAGLQDIELVISEIASSSGRAMNAPYPTVAHKATSMLASATGIL